MTEYNFSCNDNNVLLINNKDINDTNVQFLDKYNLENRFYSDIIKDGSTSISIEKGKLFYIFSTCFGYNIDNKYNYKNVLENIDVTLKPAYEDKETILKNILKTTTVGSNTQISDAKYIFCESGNSADKICRSSGIIKIKTPAAILDSISKADANEYFPGANTKITFDELFTSRLGFPPNLTWSCETINADNSEYSVTIQYDNTTSITGNISSSNKGEFQKYLQGNNVKNDQINNMTIIDLQGCPEIKKILITKELGDVAQIWLYFAFVVINIILGSNERTRENSLMITVDSVVYLFCALLNLSCVYTGSREGVVSGSCTLKHFMSGEINYLLKLQNMMNIYYKRIVSNNTAIIIGLRIINLDFNSFEYYRLNGDKLRRTYGSFNVNNNNKPDINQLFNSYIERIDDLNKIIEVGNRNFQRSLEQIVINNDTIVNVKYNEYCKLLDDYKSLHD